MKLKAFYTLLAVVVFFATLGGFFWLETSSSPSSDNAYIVPANLRPVEIGSVKKTAQDMIAGREKSSAMPIPTPETSAMGRANPFDGI